MLTPERWPPRGISLSQRFILKTLRARFLPQIATFFHVKFSFRDNVFDRKAYKVKHHPILYDLGDEDHKNCRKKYKVWDQIGLKLNHNIFYQLSVVEISHELFLYFKC